MLLYYAVVVVLAVSLIVAYVKGAKVGKAWGTPVMVLCLILILGAVGYRMFGGGGGPRPVVDPYEAERGNEERNARMLAEAIRQEISQPATVAVLLPPWIAVGDLRRDVSKPKPLWEAGFRQGLGEEKFVSLTVWQEHTDGIGIAGLPAEVAAADIAYCPQGEMTHAIARMDEPPILLVHFPAPGGRQPVSDESVRAQLADGKLDAALISDGKGGVSLIK